MIDDKSDYVLLAAMDDLSEQAQAIPSEWVALAWEAGKRPNGLYSVRHALAAVAPLIRAQERDAIVQMVVVAGSRLPRCEEFADDLAAAIRARGEAK